MAAETTLLLPPNQLSRISEDSVILCSCCGNIEVRVGGKTFVVHPMELLLLMDWLDELEDAPTPPRSAFVHYHPEIRVGYRTIAVRSNDLPQLRLLIEGALDVLDHAFPQSFDTSSFRLYLTGATTH